MSDPVFKLQVLARAELALTEIYARRAAVRSAYLAFALVFALIGLAMFNVAGYLALAEQMSPSLAAFLMSVANAFVAALVLFVGRRAGPSAGEERMARELRELAYREVSEDVDQVKARLDHLAGEVSAIGENVNRAAGTLKFLLGFLKKGSA